MAKLTAKQERVVEESMVDLNATQAAIWAGYSPVSASTVAGENMRKPQTRAHTDEVWPNSPAELVSSKSA